MGKNKEMKKRIVSEQQGMKRITNDNLICKNCKYKFDDTVKLGNTSTCQMFNVKPNEVLLGKDCIEFEKIK